MSKLVVVHLDCDTCSVAGPVSSEEFPGFTEAGALKLARMWGWSIGKRCICPECSESKLSSAALKRLEHKRRVFTLKESGATVYTVVDNAGHSMGCDHGRLCLDAAQGEQHAAIFATVNDQVPEDYHCACCLDDSYSCKKDGPNMAFVDNGEEVFPIGSDEWRSYLDKVNISL